VKKILVPLFALALVIMMVIPVSAESPNLVSNGGFETPVLGYGSWQIYLTPVSGLGWQLGPNGIEIQNHAAGSPHSGNQLCELDPYNSTYIYQDLATTSGKYYTVTFFFSARPGTSAADNHLQVKWGDTVVADLTADGSNQSDTVWTSHTYTMFAKDSTTRLTFTDLGISDSLGTYIDDVSVTLYPFDPAPPLPELPAGLLLGLGLTGLTAFIIYSRRKANARIGS
jgi:hypothetical protein